MGILDGRVAIVTGAGSGVGRSHALALAERGATVLVNDLDPRGRPDAQPEQSPVEEIIAKGGSAAFLQGDVSDPEAAKAMIDKTVADHGRLDILVNNAGVNLAALLADTDMARFKKVIDVHLMGTAYMTHAAWPVMKAARYGRVVVTTSSSIFGSPMQAAYAAAKMGIWGFMTALAMEGAQCGIRVNAIAPCAGTIDMEAGFNRDFMEAMDPKIPAQAVVYLASDDAPQGRVLFAGGGGFSTFRIVDSDGLFLGPDARAEDIRDKFAAIDAMGAPATHGNVVAQITRFNADIGLPTNVSTYAVEPERE